MVCHPSHLRGVKGQSPVAGKMRGHHRKSERGQAIILLVAVMIGLLAFVALAVDGSMVYSDRRSAQNAADAAALAAAYTLARNPGNNTAIVQAAVDRAGDNGYQTRADGSTTVTVHYPPVSPNPFAGDPNYIQVVISSKVNTSFLHFAYSGDVMNTVEAVGHAQQATFANPYDGYALVSLAPTGCSALYKNGAMTAHITGGGVLVNSNDPNCALAGNNGSINAPFLDVVGGIDNQVKAASLTISPGPIRTGFTPQFPYPPERTDPPIPDCAAMPDATLTGNTLSPGRVSGGLPGGAAILSPGIYCVEGGFTLHNGSIQGDGVMLFITGSNPCDLTWNGNATFKLSAPSDGVYKGLVMYFDPKGYASYPVGTLKFNGTSDSYIKGTVYAPTCSVQMNGTSGNSYQGQIVGYDITLLGTADINIDFNADDNVKVLTPALVDLTQ